MSDKTQKIMDFLHTLLVRNPENILLVTVLPLLILFGCFALSCQTCSEAYKAKVQVKQMELEILRETNKIVTASSTPEK